MKLHTVSITPKMVKQVITNLNSPKGSGPDCIPVVVLKNCEPELLYILAKLFNICLKESCFLDCWKVSAVTVIKNVGGKSAAKNYHPVSFLSIKMLGLTFFSKLDWGSYIISIAKNAFKKVVAMICSMKFLSPEFVLYLYKSTIWPCIECCCCVWTGALSCFLELLEKLQKRICRTVGPFTYSLWLTVEM